MRPGCEGVVIAPRCRAGEITLACALYIFPGARLWMLCRRGRGHLASGSDDPSVWLAGWAAGLVLWIAARLIGWNGGWLALLLPPLITLGIVIWGVRARRGPDGRSGDPS